MAYQFEFRPYRRRFRQALKTHHGSWTHREGIIVRLTDEEGRVGFGEIAPLPWFGSETQKQAIDFCKRLPKIVLAEMWPLIPPEWPACQFGFESAFSQCAFSQCAFSQCAQDAPYSRFSRAKWGECISRPVLHSVPPVLGCALLPTGKAALQSWQTFWKEGLRTFKLKIGVAPMQQELDWLSQLVQLLPQGVKLRLDANGGLTHTEADHWLEQCDRLGIEFLEQPLPPNQLAMMLQLRDRHQTPIALDESVATLPQLKAAYSQGWRGIFIVKPAIAGSPSQLKQFYQTHALDVVFSSVFETAIGRDAVLTLAAETASSPSPALSTKSSQDLAGNKAACASHSDTSLPWPEWGIRGLPRALGLGTQSWLEEDGLDFPDFEKVWQSL